VPLLRVVEVVLLGVITAQGLYQSSSCWCTRCLVTAADYPMVVVLPAEASGPDDDKHQHARTDCNWPASTGVSVLTSSNKAKIAERQHQCNTSNLRKLRIWHVDC
jgi:hypothetical protein